MYCTSCLYFNINSTFRCEGTVHQTTTSRMLTPRALRNNSLHPTITAAPAIYHPFTEVIT
ncbi:hypothetical protein J6590_017456 [Homalodisca vitripennis]|nr:hypothetical protein J6590_017456 [Homalodisca vitripennis]